MRKFSIDFYKKDSGKYYSSSELEIDVTEFWDGVKNIKDMHQDGKLPGLTSGGKGFHVLLRDLESNVSHLLLEEEILSNPLPLPSRGYFRRGI